MLRRLLIGQERAKMVEGAVKEPDGQQSIEEAMEYLQKVEKELPDVEFAEFLSIIEDFKSHR